VARRPVQAPQVAEALRQKLPYVHGGLNLSLEELIVPVALVADVTGTKGDTPIRRFWRGFTVGAVAGSSGGAVLVNPVDSGVLVTVDAAELVAGGGDLNFGILQEFNLLGPAQRGWLRDRPSGAPGGTAATRPSGAGMNTGLSAVLTPLEQWVRGQTSIELPEPGFATLEPGSAFHAWAGAQNQTVRVWMAWSETSISQGP